MLAKIQGIHDWGFEPTATGDLSHDERAALQALGYLENAPTHEH